MTIAPTAVDVLRQHVLPKLDHVKKVDADKFKASCPVPGHGKGNGDRNPSMTVARGDTQPVVFRCHVCEDQEAVKDALIRYRGIDWALVSEHHPDSPITPDTWMPCGYDRDTRRTIPGHRKVAEYLYRDEDGVVVFGTARCALKGKGCEGFRQWRPDPTSKSGRRWSLTLDDHSKVGAGLPYRLPEALAAIAAGMNVWIVEGEKDADRLARVGIAAVCNAEGAGKWTDRHAKWLSGADVIVVVDRDDPGWRHAEAVTNTLLPIARSIELVRAATGKDTSDHFGAGHKLHQFVQIAKPRPAPTAVPGCPDCVAEGARA